MAAASSSTNPNPPGPTPHQSPHISPVPSRPSSPQPASTYFSHSQNKRVELPQLKDEFDALLAWRPRDGAWKNQTCLFPEPIYTLETQPEIMKTNFRLAAQRALSKWRQVGS